MHVASSASGIVCGVKKMTVYLPDELKADLERLASETRRSQADVIREGVRIALERSSPPLPHFGIFDGGDGSLGERVDELLKGFGSTSSL